MFWPKNNLIYKCAYNTVFKWAKKNKANRRPIKLRLLERGFKMCSVSI